METISKKITETLAYINLVSTRIDNVQEKMMLIQQAMLEFKKESCVEYINDYNREDIDNFKSEFITLTNKGTSNMIQMCEIWKKLVAAWNRKLNNLSSMVLPHELEQEPEVYLGNVTEQLKEKFDTEIDALDRNCSQYIESYKEMIEILSSIYQNKIKTEPPIDFDTHIRMLCSSDISPLLN